MKRYTILLTSAVLAAATCGGSALAAEGPENKINGTNRDDTIRGTALDDYVQAQRGDDTVAGRGGDDTIIGEASVLDPPGNDVLSGATGMDIIIGGPGNDTVKGGSGADHIAVNEEDEFFGTKAERDTVSCGPGVDTYAADPIDRVSEDCEINELE